MYPCAGQPFEVAMLLPPPRAQRLGAALPADACIRRLEHWTQLHALCEHGLHAIVIDPLECDSPFDLNDALRAVAPCVPLVVYTAFSPSAMRRLLDVSMLAGATLVLDGIDDRPDILRAAVIAARDAARSRHAVEELRARAGPLPPDVDLAIAELLIAARRPLTVIELARAAHMCVRTLERRLCETGAPPPGWLIDTARAIVARDLLRSSAMTVGDVARRVGYAKLDSLRALLRRAFDASPSAIRDHGCATDGPRWACTRAPRERVVISGGGVAESGCQRGSATHTTPTR